VAQGLKSELSDPCEDIYTDHDGELVDEADEIFQTEENVMTAKAIAFQILQELPDDVSMADVIEELELRLAIDEGLRQLDDGQGIPHEQVKERFAQWLK